MNRPSIHASQQWARRAAIGMLCGVASLAAATPPTFHGLGVLPGGADSAAFGISSNGTVIVGSSSTPFGDRAFRWSKTTGMQTLGVLPGGVDSYALAVSADGKVIAGYGSTPAGTRGFTWTAAAGMKNLGVLPGGNYSLASAVSSNGAVIIGYSNVDHAGTLDYRAVRWTGPGQATDLGVLSGGTNSYGQAVSADGSVIVGVGDADNSFNFRAFRLTSESGMQNLGVLPDGTFSIPLGVSSDGSTVVGWGRSPSGLTAFRWTGQDGMVDLGRFPGSENAQARAVSGDGAVIVGFSESTSGDLAFIWTAKLGMVDLNTYLIARGVNLSGWTLTAAYAITPDGLTVAGTGDHNGHNEAWVAFLGEGQDLSPIEQLGKSIMFDATLSAPVGQSCSSCHAAAAGFANPISEINAHGAVHFGAVNTLFGNRKPPTAAYAGESPPLHFDGDTWVGGLFFDGRATGWTLGDPLAEQAMQPFLNPVEQNNPALDAVIAKIAASNYATLFKDVWGPDSLPSEGSGDPSLAYERTVRSIAAYERSREVNPFNSKYDDYLAGRTTLSKKELQGLRLFEGAAGCAACHPSQPGPNGEPPLFTDYTYDNIGMPANPENPFYIMPDDVNPDGGYYVDPGLGGFLQHAGYPPSVFGPQLGKHKVPTLRNVDRRPDADFAKAYGHNGYFKTLEEIVHFYNTRDVEPWPLPEVPQNVNAVEMGNLHLTADEEAALVAFLKTLTDRDTSTVLCPSDFDRSGFVDLEDFERFVAAFELGLPGADFDRSGFVDAVDFDLFVIAFEMGC